MFNDYQPYYGPLGQASPASNTDSGGAQFHPVNYGDLGFSGTDTYAGNSDFLKNLGWTGGNPYSQGLGDGTESGKGLDSGYSPEFLQFLQDKGISFQNRSDQTSRYLQGFDQSGNKIGGEYQTAIDPDNAFLLASLGAAGFAGAAAGGAFAGSGAFGSGGSAGGVSGMDLAADAGTTGANSIDAAGAQFGSGGYPVSFNPYTGPGSQGFQVAGDNPVAPEGWGTTGGTSFAQPTTAAGIDSAAGTAGYGGSSAGIGGGVGDLTGIAGPTAGGGGLLSQLGGYANDASSWMKANPGLTNVGGGLVNSLVGAYTSNNALNAQKDATNQANALLQPYRDTGINALGKLNGLMSNPSSITSDPGYAFGLGQGLQGVDRSAASKGGLYSGATLKALDRYGQDYAGTKLNDAYSRYGSVAQLGATGTQNMANNTTGLGNAAAGTAFYQGNTVQNGVNNALGQFNFQNGGYYGNSGQNPFNQSAYQQPKP